VKTFAEALVASERYEKLLDVKRKAGLASAAARRAKYGEGLVAHLRSIASSGGRARVATMSEEHRRRLASDGGKAGWEKLSPEQALAKRRRAWAAALSSLTPEQRSANGKRAMEKRWRKSDAA
jgi:hypothetical protein